MAQRLISITNITPQPATYSSTEYSQDSCSLASMAVTHTGGSDDDYVKIADCSEAKYFDKHHCTIAANDRSWTVTIWNDDDNKHKFYWSPNGNYTTANPVTNSENWLEVALIVAPGPVVYCSEWS